MIREQRRPVGGDRPGREVQSAPTSYTRSTPTPSLALRPREAARALGVSERTLWSWTQAGEIPHVKMGRSVLYPTAALERWLAERSEGVARE